MNTSLLASLIIAGTALSIVLLLNIFTQADMLTFDEWNKRVKSAPWPQTQAQAERGHSPKPLLSQREIKRVQTEFDRVISDESAKLSQQSQKANWLHHTIGGPFAQKIQVSNKSQIIFHGDLHGDVHSPVTMIEFFNHVDIMDGFSIKGRYKNSFYIVFLGDYVNRGWYSNEALYTLKRLKIANPDNIFLSLGNNDPEYSKLSSVLYISVPGETHNNVIQCNHAAIELGYDPKRLLEEPQDQAFEEITLDRAGAYAKHPKLKNYYETVSNSGYFSLNKPRTGNDLGFVADFIDTEEDQFITQNRKPTQKMIDWYLQVSSTEKNKIRGIFRAHQHSTRQLPLMKMMVTPSAWQEGEDNRGIARIWKPTEHTDPNTLWDGMVTTLNISPLSYTGPVWGYKYDTFAVLFLANTFKDWRMYAIHTYPKEQDIQKRFSDTQKYRDALRQHQEVSTR